MSGSMGAMLLAAVGYRNGQYSRFVHETGELISTARELRAELEVHKEAPDPFGSLLSTMHNNREFEKFSDHAVDVSKS